MNSKNNKFTLYKSAHYLGGVTIGSKTITGGAGRDLTNVGAGRDLTLEIVHISITSTSPPNIIGNV